MKVKELFEKNLEATLLEMANLDSNDTGINRVIIWVGVDPQQHYLRVKVSNVPDKWSNDNFTITLPEMNVVGKVGKWITGSTLELIKNWIQLNIEVITAYEQGEIVSTRDFLSRIRKI